MSLQNAGLADGDEIAVMDGELAVGTVEYDSDNPAAQLLAWEDDAFTGETDGFAGCYGMLHAFKLSI